jgi:endo-1,4-beta-xylanase
VKTVCARYGRRIYSYDVVNEAVQPETGAIRDTNVTRALGGEGFLDLMFHTAREAAPHAQLVYNDYMSWERNREDETHIRGVLKLLEGFKKRGTPVDALGVQSHIRLLKPLSVAQIVRESEGPWRRFLDEVVGMGYQLLITEFDVNDRMAPTAIAARDRMVTDYAKAYLDVMLSYPQLGDILCWGMCDRYSWLENFDPRADKAPKRGTPYDAKFRPKLLRTAIASAFAQAKSRHA